MKALLRQSVLSLCMFLFVPFVGYSQFAQMDEDNVGDIVEGNHRGIVNSEKSLFDGILGLRWGMRMEDALEHLCSMLPIDSISTDDEAVFIPNTVYWNNIRYDFVRVGYLVSNLQREYLSEICFYKGCGSSKEAKEVRESIMSYFRRRIDADDIEEKIGDDGFKEYLIYQRRSSEVGMSRIRLDIVKMSDSYVVCLSYGGWLEAAKKVACDEV